MYLSKPLGVSNVTSDVLILIGGQSNVGDAPATGRVAYSLMPGYLKAYQSKILQYNASTAKFENFQQPVDQEYGWLTEIVRLRGTRTNGRKLYFYKYGEGGTRLAESGSGALYNRQTLLRNGIAAINEFLKYARNPSIYFLWDHGYTDGLDLTNAQEYQYNLRHFFKELRRYWKIPEMQIIFTRLSVNATSSTNKTTIQAGQEVAATYTVNGKKLNTIVNSDTAEYQADGAHYSNKGVLVVSQSINFAIDYVNPKGVNRINDFHPIQLNPISWYEAREIDIENTVAEVRVSGGTFVRKLNDISGNVARLVDITTTHQPELINGGTDTAYMNFVLAHSLSSTLLCETFCQSSFEMFWYIDFNDGQPTALRVLFEAISAGDTISIFIDGNNKLTCRLVNNVDLSAKTNLATFVNGQTGKKLVNIRVDYGAAQMSIYVDGSNIALDGVNNGVLTTFSTSGFIPGQFALGNRDTYSATTGLDARLYAFGIFPLLNSTDRIKVEQYLSY